MFSLHGRTARTARLDSKTPTGSFEPEQMYTAVPRHISERSCEFTLEIKFNAKRTSGYSLGITRFELENT